MQTMWRVIVMALAMNAPLWAQSPGDTFTQYLAALDNVGRILAEVKESEGAKAALPKLQAAIGQVNASKAQLRELKLDANNPQHAALMKEQAPQAQQVTVRVSQEVTRVRSSPQLEQVLHETLAKLP